MSIIHSYFKIRTFLGRNFEFTICIAWLKLGYIWILKDIVCFTYKEGKYRNGSYFSKKKS